MEKMVDLCIAIYVSVDQAGYGSKNIGRSISSGDQGFIAIHIDDLPSGRIIDLGDGLSMVYNMV